MYLRSSCGKFELLEEFKNSIGFHIKVLVHIWAVQYLKGSSKLGIQL
jgi:hypothetical protein